MVSCRVNTTASHVLHLHRTRWLRGASAVRTLTARDAAVSARVPACDMDADILPSIPNGRRCRHRLLSPWSRHRSDYGLRLHPPPSGARRGAGRWHSHIIRAGNYSRPGIFSRENLVAAYPRSGDTRHAAPGRDAVSLEHARRARGMEAVLRYRRGIRTKS